ncbi:MAG: efflux RND transporter periplasmic adaptor subunit [Desulfobulbales bacterium]|nr:efflux RND transporter periplasmic adaptor subunit [Desulfobulbales bacterium]
MGAKQKAVKIILPILVLALGVFAMRMLILNRPVPQRQVRENPGALVKVIRAEKQDRRIQVFGNGTVQPEQEVTITLQVSGVINKVAPGFTAGAFFRQGELLFAVESIDYELAVERARAALIRAENEITVIESKAAVARQEWEKLKLENETEPNPLIVYKPQYEDAKANRTAAAAALKQAELDLQRTRITAPFNCMVRSEEVGIGKYVRAGNNVAKIASVDAVEIFVPLPLDDLRWLNIPRGKNSAEGSPATVQLEVGAKLYQWQGLLVRSLGEVDMKSRMAQVVVRVEDPYRLRKEEQAQKFNLELGMFVEVVLAGETLPDVVEIPRGALRQDSTVWVMDSEQKLKVVDVEIIRQQKETVLLAGSLEHGARVILTALPGGVEGMKLRPAGTGDSK